MHIYNVTYAVSYNVNDWLNFVLLVIDGSVLAVFHVRNYGNKRRFTSNSFELTQVYRWLSSL